MFHHRLIELESELVAKEQAKRGLPGLPVDCQVLMQFIEQEVGVRLADKCPRDWKGWLSYRRNKDSLVICRGRSCPEGLLGKARAGLDVPLAADTVTEYQRGFDVSPPQDLDHLLINFGGDDEPRVFLWYGENIAPYKLIFAANTGDDPHKELSEAIVDACTWILKRPKDKTLSQYLLELESQG